MFDETVKNQLEQALRGIRETLEASVADLKQDPKMVKIIETQIALNNLEGMLDRPKTSLAEVFGLESSEAKESSTAVRIDEFFGLLPLEAAKRYLKKKGEAATLDEIVEKIRAGGCRVNSPANLRKTLTRSTWQVAKVGKDAFGLVEFYGGRKRVPKKERVAESETEADETESEGEAEEVVRVTA